LPEDVKTIADWIIQATEDAINAHLTVRPLTLEAPVNPANSRAAIRRLRNALQPFVRGSVDNETAEIVPRDLDDKLAVREQQLATLHLPPAPQRALALLCQRIEILVRQFSSANNQTVSVEDTLRYVDAALNFAGVNHPNIAKHRDRLARLAYPKKTAPVNGIIFPANWGTPFAMLRASSSRGVFHVNTCHVP
jgi:hypothetical protein